MKPQLPIANCQLQIICTNCARSRRRHLYCRCGLCNVVRRCQSIVVGFPHVRKGYAKGTYNLVTPHNHAMTNTEIAWAAPVLWIKTKI